MHGKPGELNDDWTTTTMMGEENTRDEFRSQPINKFQISNSIRLGSFALHQTSTPAMERRHRTLRLVTVSSLLDIEILLWRSLCDDTNIRMELGY